jgi:exodeoxyribonuclease VIII
MKNHVMVDLETLGGSPDGRIVSIGAVRFDPHQGWNAAPLLSPHATLADRCPERTFYRAVECRKSVGRIDLDTVLWWMEQSEPIRKEALSGTMSLEDVLNEFSIFCDGADRLWSNGPTFDETILRSAYRHYGLEFPIHYKGSRCMRTLLALAREFGVEIPVLSNENKHNSLADAVRQAKLVTLVIQELRKERL